MAGLRNHYFNMKDSVSHRATLTGQEPLTDGIEKKFIVDGLKRMAFGRDLPTFYTGIFGDLQVTRLIRTINQFQ